MQLKINNSYTKAKPANKEELDLLVGWCTKEYDFYGLDFSKRPPRRVKKTAYIRYVKFDEFKTSIYFPSGWSGRFIEKLKAQEIPVTWDDKRVLPTPTSDYLPNRLPKLRDYQQEALDKCISSGRGIIHHATGAGKTVVMAALLNNLRLNAIIIVPTLNLLIQTTEEFKKFLGEDVVGMIGEGEFDPKLFTVATVQSLWSRIKKDDNDLKKVFKECQVLALDEAHHINVAGKDKIQNTYFKIAQLLDCYYKFGLTATPGDEGTLERELLEAATGRILHFISSSELIKRGLLTRPIIQMYKITPPQRFSDWQTAYKQNILRNTRRNALICRLAEDYASKGKSVLITVTRVEEHGGVLNDMIESAVFMSGSTPSEERKKMLEDFGSKKRKILISTVVNEGVNIPSMDVIIMAGGGKSSKQTVQRVGRALRTAQGKQVARIIDFYDADSGILQRHSRARLRTYKKEEEYEISEMIVI